MIAFPRETITDEDAALDWWERKFAVACEELGVQVNAAALVRNLVSCLREIRRASLDRTLSLTEAANEIGFSAKQVGRWVRGGKVENVGTSTAPRVRRGDIINRRKKPLPQPSPVRIVDTAQDIARSVANSERRRRDG